MAIRHDRASIQRALRVGVFLGDQLVEEQLFVGEAPVRIGQSLRCELSIPVDALPQVHTLFVSEHGQRQLRVTPAMRGQLADGTTVCTELQRGDVGAWTLPIARGGHGRIEIGEATIVFEELAAPAAAAPLELPRAMRRTLRDRVDPRLAAIVGASLMAHLAIGTWASLVDRELDLPLVDPETGEYQHTTVIENPVLPELPTTPTSPTTATPPSPSPAPGIATPVRPSVQTPSTVGQRPTSPRPPTTMTREQAERMAQVLAGAVGDPGGPGEMRRHRPQADLERQLAEIRNGAVEIGNSGRIRPSSDPQIAARPGTIVDGPPALGETPGKAEQPVRLVPRALPGESTASTLTADHVLAKVQSHYLAGLQRCYRKGLAEDATLAGTLKLTFTVDERGQVTDASASGLAGVAACVEAQMASWRFAIPRDRAGDAREADFGISLALQPS